MISHRQHEGRRLTLESGPGPGVVSPYTPMTYDKVKYFLFFGVFIGDRVDI
jgi:hypothetical protein